MCKLHEWFRRLSPEHQLTRELEADGFGIIDHEVVCLECKTHNLYPMCGRGVTRRWYQDRYNRLQRKAANRMALKDRALTWLMHFNL